jgi:MFS family permease
VLTTNATQVYPFGIFSSTIISGLNPEGKLIETVGFGTAINSFYLPGCILGGLLMDKIGRRQTMTLGFVLWSILGFIIGGAVFPIMEILPLFIVLYGIFNGLGEMGPGVSYRFLCAVTIFHSLTFLLRSPLSSAAPSRSPLLFAVISSVSQLQ